jgi:hypothetical protein
MLLVVGCSHLRNFLGAPLANKVIGSRESDAVKGVTKSREACNEHIHEIIGCVPGGGLALKRGV